MNASLSVEFLVRSRLMHQSRLSKSRGTAESAFSIAALTSFNLCARQLFRPIARRVFQRWLVQELASTGGDVFAASSTIEVLVKSRLRKDGSAHAVQAPIALSGYMRAAMRLGLISYEQSFLLEAARTLVACGLVTRTLACEAVLLASSRHIGLLQTLRELGWNQAVVDLICDCTDLMLSAGYIDAAQCYQLRQTCIANGDLLTTTVLNQKLLSSKEMYDVLRAVALLQSRTCKRDKVVAALRLVAATGMHLDEATVKLGVGKQGEKPQPRLGELLLLSDLIQEIELLNCTEIALQTRELLENTIASSGLATLTEIRQAVKVQQMIVLGHVSMKDGVEQVRSFCNRRSMQAN